MKYGLDKGSTVRFLAFLLTLDWPTLSVSWSFPLFSISVFFLPTASQPRITDVNVDTLWNLHLSRNLLTLKFYALIPPS